MVLDLFSRRVVGWAMENHLGHELALAALDMAIARQRPAPGLTHHSDRGVQFAACEYRKRLKQHGILCSMSRKGNCWDNAPMESFYATLKGELVEQRDYLTRDEARADIFQFLEGWYNRRRLHSALGYITPEQKLTNPLIFSLVGIGAESAGFVEVSAQSGLEHRGGQGG